MSDKRDIKLTAASERLLMAYASDAINWDGSVLVGGNVGHKPADKGNLTDLKIKGLVTTFQTTDPSPYGAPDQSWLNFTELGVACVKAIAPSEDWSDLGDYVPQVRERIVLSPESFIITREDDEADTNSN